MRCNKCGFQSDIDFAHACMTDKEFEKYVRSTHTAHEFKEIESLRQQLAVGEASIKRFIAADEAMQERLAECEKHKEMYREASHEKGEWIRNHATQLATVTAERDELAAALTNITNYDHAHCTMPQDLQEIAAAALAKLGADKTGEGS